MASVIMLCMQCKAQGRVSELAEGARLRSAEFCQPYIDDDGTYHRHDHSVIFIEYRCSRGHKVQTRHAPGACSCGWRAELPK